jgi:hypothetical protein
VAALRVAQLPAQRSHGEHPELSRLPFLPAPAFVARSKGAMERLSDGATERQSKGEEARLWQQGRQQGS